MRPNTRLAGFRPRLWAYLIDSTIVGLVPLLVRFVGLHFFGQGPCHVVSSTLLGRVKVCEPPVGPSNALSLVSTFIAIVLAVIFVIVPMGRDGVTVGGRLLQLRVVDTESGAAIGWPRALLRYAVSLVSGCLCYAGFLFMVFDDKKRTLHDFAASSIVIVDRTI